MQLEAQGKPAPDRPGLRVSRHVHRRVPASGWSGITLHHLLSHTSGISNFTNDTEVMVTLCSLWRRRLDITWPLPSQAAGGHARREGPVQHFRSTTCSGSVEKAAGASFGTVLQRQILDPLGMRSTGLWQREAVLPERPRDTAATRRA